MSESKWSFAEKFCRDFHVTTSELQSRLDDLKLKPVASLDAVQVISAEISSLARSLGDATGSLPSYDQRRCELQLKSLERTADELCGIPTSAVKFAFKRKIVKSKIAPASAASPTSLLQSTSPMIGLAKPLYSCRYLTSANFDSENTAEVSMHDLDKCIINLLPNDNNQMDLSAFHVQRATRCVFLLPFVNGSVLVHDLSDCVIVSRCHQFRMHNSTTVDVYLSISSNPIIERCTSIRFAAYPSVLCGVYEPSKYFSVQDFSHIRSTPSPNWTTLSEEDWECFWPVHELEGKQLLEHLEGMLRTRKVPRSGAS
ncbi:tubulin binding cofactor C-domain-containing protein [Phlebopus sp. FC_14]|nr:tubulin binding cofactor C-domain-containing protein [Phlebopus sp. FC_14]